MTTDAWPEYTAEEWHVPWAANYTMIYTEAQKVALATELVNKEIAEAAKEQKPELTEEEKERLWNLVLQSCSG